MIRTGRLLAAGSLAAGIAVAPAAAEPDGQALYARHCLACHQADGGGVPDFQPALIGSPVVTGAPETLIAWTFLGNPPDAPPGQWSNAMPGFAGLSDSEMASILTYIRTAFGHDGPVADAKVSADQVAGVRASLNLAPPAENPAQNH